MKNKKILIICIIIAISFLGIYFFNSRPVISEIVTNNTELSFVNQKQGEISVYNFMEQLQNEGKMSFKEKNYSGMGKFIEEINGVRNSGEKNWIYYVNGIKANVGVSNYKVNKGDIVSWKYEKSF